MANVTFIPAKRQVGNNIKKIGSEIDLFKV